MPIVAAPSAVSSVLQFSEVVAAYAERKIVPPVYDASYLLHYLRSSPHRSAVEEQATSAEDPEQEDDDAGGVTSVEGIGA
jgi:hypothetical protein